MSQPYRTFSSYTPKRFERNMYTSLYVNDLLTTQGGNFGGIFNHLISIIQNPYMLIRGYFPFEEMGVFYKGSNYFPRTYYRGFNREFRRHEVSLYDNPMVDNTQMINDTFNNKYIETRPVERKRYMSFPVEWPTKIRQLLFLHLREERVLNVLDLVKFYNLRFKNFVLKKRYLADNIIIGDKSLLFEHVSENEDSSFRS